MAAEREHLGDRDRRDDCLRPGGERRLGVGDRAHRAGDHARTLAPAADGVGGAGRVQRDLEHLHPGCDELRRDPVQIGGAEDGNEPLRHDLVDGGHRAIISRRRRLEEDEPVEGRVAVVTGSARHRRPVAEAFAAAGAEVIGLDREQADLSRQIESFFAGLERMDVLFNGAGISGRSLGDGRWTSAPSKAGTRCSRTT